MTLQILPHTPADPAEGPHADTRGASPLVSAPIRRPPQYPCNTPGRTAQRQRNDPAM